MEKAEEITEKLVLLITSPECYNEFFLKMNFMHLACIKSTLSRTLGAIVVATSSAAKIPQLQKIFQSGSSVGISLSSTLLELFSLSGATAYSYVSEYPFSTYGECVFLILQTWLMGVLVLLIAERRLAAALFVLLYPAALYVLVSGRLPLLALWLLQTLSVPSSVAAKANQALATYQRGSTGQISAVTVAVTFAGSLVRVFTSAHDTGDPTLVVASVAMAIANGVVALQVWYYWHEKSD